MTAAEERAAIVAWLRGESRMYETMRKRSWLPLYRYRWLWIAVAVDMLATAIEAGAHLQRMGNGDG